MIECKTLDGKTILVPKESLQLRVSAYAIVFHEEQILLVITRTTGKWDLPGGGVDLGEKLAEGLNREVMEEAGIEVEIGRLIHFAEEFFYYEPTDEAFQSYRFYYLCEPLTTELVADDLVKDDEVETPRWVSIHELQASDFQSYGEMVMQQINTIRRG